MICKEVLFRVLDERAFKEFLKGISIWTLLISAPMLYHQFAMLRPGFFWYWPFLCFLIMATSLLLAYVAGRGIAWDDLLVSQRIFGTVASYSAAFFPVWLATFGPEVLGRNAWRGNVLSINIITGLIGLSGGVWAALALRWLRPGTFSCPRLLKIAAGGMGLQIFWFISSRVQAIPSLTTIVHALTQGGWHEYTCYFFWEAFMSSLLWPAGLTAGLLLYLGREKIFIDDPDEKKFKKQQTPSWWD
ncbi:MAG: hypothetical protein WC450_04110 [Candidatus Omnitrophota bacterium]